MLLAVDIGNTNITLGIFENDSLIKTFRLESDIHLSADDYEIRFKSLLKDYAVNACIIGSVVNELTSVIKIVCDKVFGCDSILFSAKDLGMKIALKEPEKVGADRLINAYAVMSGYSLPAIVVDIGTAITFDVVSKDKEFLGGAIMPGVNLQFQALKRYTSKLPLVSAGESKKAIGENTEAAILSGVVRGIAGSVEGLVSQCEAELGERAIVIATGGQSSLIANYLTRKFDISSPNLTLEGLKLAYLNSHVNLY